jgi:hypothetical protein
MIATSTPVSAATVGGPMRRAQAQATTAASAPRIADGNLSQKSPALTHGHR